MSYESTITVLGAGAGAMSWAAHLAQRDWTVLMAARTAGALQEIASVGKVTLDEGERTGDYPVEIVDDPVEAVSRGRWTIICIPADRLPGYRETVIRELGPQQVLLVAPGNTGGALYLGSGFGFEPPFELLELNTLPFVARRTGPTTVRKFVTLRHVYWASLRHPREQAVVEWMESVVDGAIRVPSVLQTALTNFNPVVHPPVMLLQAGRIESLGGFRWYVDGSTPSAGRLMAAVDEERMAVQRAYGLEPVSFGRFFDLAGYSPGTPARDDIAETLRSSEANATITGPSTLEHRFLDEDVPYGLVPLAALAGRAGIWAPVSEALITLSEVITGNDYRGHGLNAGRLGLDLGAFEELLVP